MKTINSKGISTVAIIGIVVVVLLAGGLVWWQVGKDDSGNSNRNLNNNVNSTSNLNENANSNTQPGVYNNSEYGFRIQYPSDWELTKLDNPNMTGYSEEIRLASIDKISETGSYPDPQRPLDLSVGVGIIPNTNNQTLDQIFNEEYAKCQNDNENVEGCFRQYGDVQWKAIQINGYTAFQSGIVGPIIDNDNVFIKDGDHYIHISGMYYQYNDQIKQDFKDVYTSTVILHK